MGACLLKIQKNKNITLPTWLMKQFHVNLGDFVRLEETQNGVLIKPAKWIDPSQAYFWTQEWQEGEKKAQENVRQGKVKKFKNVKSLMKDLRSQ